MLFEFPVVPLFLMTIQNLIQILFQPFFYAVIFMVYWQSRALRDQQRYLFGHDNMPIGKLVFECTCQGLLGGVLASMIMVFTGLPINHLGIEYIWPLAILLLMINVRFLCFAYAGGLVALSNIIFGWPYIEVSHILGLVAILHITESFLVFLGGRFSDLPIYIMHKGEAVGGFILTNFWPLPLLLMVVVGVPSNEVADVINMPDWWPLFPVAKAQAGYENVLMPITVAAILGYSSVAITHSPKTKRLMSAGALFCYSVFLLFMAYLSINNVLFSVLAACTSILGHELVVYLDQKSEFSGQPIYTKAEDKFIIFSTIYNSPAYNAGIKNGDILLELNGNEIQGEEDLLLIMRFLPPKFTIKVLRDGKVITKNAQFLPDEEKMLGLIRMPAKNRDRFMTLDGNYSLFYKWYRKFRNR